MLSHLTKQPEEEYMSEHHREMKAYQVWAMKDRCVCSTILSSMYNDLVEDFENNPRHAKSVRNCL